MSDCVEYVLDSGDRIIEIGGQWDAFARSNDAENLCGDSVVGTSFWDHVSGESLRDLLARVFQRARSIDQPISVPARCDSPDTVRHLEIRVFARSPERLEFRSCTLSEVPRKQWRVSDRVRVLLQMCSWCNRFHYEGQWMEIEKAIEEYDLVNADVVPQTSHGICPECAVVLEAAATAREGVRDVV